MEFARKFAHGAGKASTAPSGGAAILRLLSPANREIDVSKTPSSRPRKRRNSVLDSADVAQLAQVSSAAPVPPQNLEAEESVLGAMMLSRVRSGR